MTLIEILEQMWKIFRDYYLGCNMLGRGVGYTLLLSAIAVAAGAVIGSFFAIAKGSKIAPLRWIITAIVEIIRGTPALLQLYIGFFVVPMLLPFMDLSAFQCVAIALTINSAAYVSEIIRSGIEAVDKGQTEAARSLGLSSGTTMLKVVLPQAIKNILPALGNEFITVIKETSLASTFYVGELMTTYSEIKGTTFNALPILMDVGLIYFVLTFTLSKGLGAVERRLKKNDRH